MAGGTFLRFQVGSVGGSSAHLRYISRPAAVRDGKAGVLLHNLPDAEQEASFVLLRDHLIAYAWLREYAERRQGGGVRTFYHAILGFESDVGSEPALSLVNTWLRETFPQAQAAAFLHRDTKRLHAHVWINARDSTGRKLQIGYHQFRSLDEVWNGIYARVLGHATDEHLEKKNETRWAKRLLITHSPRIGYTPERAWFHQQELRNAGHDELEKGGFGGNQSTTPNRIPDAPDRERGYTVRESEAHRRTDVADETARKADRALSEAHRLHQDASHLGSAETQLEEVNDRKRERER